MNLEDALYISKGNRSSKVIYQNQTKIFDLTINNLINKELQKSLSTIESRLLSTKRAYNIQKYVPIYINQSCILQPISKTTDWNYTLVNVCNIKDVLSINNQTIIRFDGDISLIVDLSIRRLKNYLKNCYKILETQKTIERDNINYVKEKH